MQLEGPSDMLIYHDVSESFGPLLKEAMSPNGRAVCAALGPMYETDPAEKLLFPFIRADVESGWSARPRYPHGLPDHIADQAKKLRQDCVDDWLGSGGWWGDGKDDRDLLNDWTRAGLVLEICRRRGVNVRGLGKAHVNWRLRGTETGRFGASYSTNKSSAFPNGFNPLTIPKAERSLVVPSAGGRLVSVIDFKAIDLCSMIKLVPGLDRHYEDCVDPHTRTAEILDVDRDVAKEQIFVHAYGGQSHLRHKFELLLPELSEVRKLPHGQFPRNVQSLSAKAFRAGLSRALPLLLSDSVIPMFTVHDELVLDIDESAIDASIDVANALQEGATDRIGSKYMTSMSWGLSYAEAKEQ